MAKRASEWIPQNILTAAQRAGLSAPLWYVGRNNGHDSHERKKTFEDLVSDADTTGGGSKAPKVSSRRTK